MLRTIFSVGVLAVIGLFLLSVVFNILGALVGITIWALILAVKIACIGAVAYVVVRLVSPRTARRLRERWDDR
ncbi:MAG TPA: hypothetical protein VFW98_04045 [Gemmatimonadaceae bacterium]|nr:hypothetical protein [Gemmatimonadaceae bacterium]